MRRILGTTAVLRRSPISASLLDSLLILHHRRETHPTVMTFPIRLQCRSLKRLLATGAPLQQTQRMMGTNRSNILVLPRHAMTGHLSITSPTESNRARLQGHPSARQHRLQQSSIESN
ncbi:hypothetical protein [Stenomitos frigidus]|uniref:hypothetical protein n=1 Tax=Stenomitos frigidus TaxID=1886765 RepID=UPI0011B27F67|nr:hypothetical protein [Stenomitos frigidus]